jgi:hypothetical protein
MGEAKSGISRLKVGPAMPSVRHSRAVSRSAVTWVQRPKGAEPESRHAGRQKAYSCKVERLGRIQSLPAFDPKRFETAAKDATGCERATAHSL